MARPNERWGRNRKLIATNNGSQRRAHRGRGRVSFPYNDRTGGGLFFSFSEKYGKDVEVREVFCGIWTTEV